MAPILKTYTNKNTTCNKSEDAFDALFAQNILKRKQTNALKKRKNVYNIKDLPQVPHTATLLEDSNPLFVNVNSTFDRLLHEGNLNAVTARRTRSQTRKSSQTDSTNQLEKSALCNSLKSNNVSLEVEYINIEKNDSLNEIPCIRSGLVSSTPFKRHTRQSACNDSLPSFITKADQQLFNESLQQIKDWSQKPPDFKPKPRGRHSHADWKLKNCPKVVLNKVNSNSRKRKQKELFVKITKLSESLISKKLTNRSVLIKAKDFTRLIDSCGANISEALSAGDVNQLSIKSASLEDFEKFALSVSENLLNCEDISEVVMDDAPVTNDSNRKQASVKKDQFVNKRTRKNGVVTEDHSNVKKKLNLSDSSVVTRSRSKGNKSIESEISMAWTLARSGNTYVTRRNKQYNNSLPSDKSVSIHETTNKTENKKGKNKDFTKCISRKSSADNTNNKVLTSPESNVSNDVSLTPFKSTNCKSSSNIENNRISEPLRIPETLNNSILNQSNKIIDKLPNDRLKQFNNSTHEDQESIQLLNKYFINTNRRKFININEKTSTTLNDTEENSRISIDFHFKNNMQGQSFKKEGLEIHEISDSSEGETEEEVQVATKKIILDLLEIQRNKLEKPFIGFPKSPLDYRYKICKKEEPTEKQYSYDCSFKSPEAGEISSSVKRNRRTNGSIVLTNSIDEVIGRDEASVDLANSCGEIDLTSSTRSGSKQKETIVVRSGHNRISIDLTGADTSVTALGRSGKRDTIDLTRKKKINRESRVRPENANLVVTKRGSGRSQGDESIDLTNETNQINKRVSKRSRNNDRVDVTAQTIDLTSEKVVQSNKSVDGRTSANAAGINSMVDKSDVIFIEESFVKPISRHFIKAGKKWRRSLSIYKRNSFISKRPKNMPEPISQVDDCLMWVIDINVIKHNNDIEKDSYRLQKRKENQLVELTVCRNSIRLVPVPTPKKESKRLSPIGSYAIRKSYAPNNIQGALEQILEGLSVSSTEETQHLSIEDNCNNETPAPFVTARDIVLRRCGQTEPVAFSECYPPAVLKNCHKVGEGVYGEVFLFRNKMGTTSVMKVIPIEGDLIVNGERQKKFEEILTEIIIAMELSDLRKNKKNSTSGFNEVSSIHCVRGQYPERLLDLWDLYKEDRGSENDCPDVFGPEQLYIVLELMNGGKDLESYVFNNAMQAYSLFQQAACSLAVAEVALQFEHRDLHWGNILILGTDKNKKLVYNLSGRQIEVPSNGVQISIIDFTLSRITFDSVCIYNDLGQDPDLFNAEGDYQFEIYRLMQKCNQNEWQHYEPYTNILWLHYTLDKMLTVLRYKYPTTKCHEVYFDKMKELKGQILEFKSVEEFVTQTFV